MQEIFEQCVKYRHEENKGKFERKSVRQTKYDRETKYGASNEKNFSFYEMSLPTPLNKLAGKKWTKGTRVKERKWRVMTGMSVCAHSAHKVRNAK